MKTAPAQPQNAGLCEQLAIIDQSQQYIILIIAALILSYYATSVQRNQLVCAAAGCKCGGNVLPVRVTSSVLIIAALLFFYQLSQSTLCKCRCGGNADGCCSPTLNHMANILVLAAALMRLWDLLAVQPAARGCAQ